MIDVLVNTPWLLTWCGYARKQVDRLLIWRAGSPAGDAVLWRGFEIALDRIHVFTKLRVGAQVA